MLDLVHKKPIEQHDSPQYTKQLTHKKLKRKVMMKGSKQLMKSSFGKELSPYSQKNSILIDDKANSGLSVGIGYAYSLQQTNHDSNILQVQTTLDGSSKNISGTDSLF